MDMTGHNSATAYEELSDRIALLIGTADRWLAERPEIKTEDEAAKLKDFLDQLRAEDKAVKAEHKAEKAPHLEAGREVDAKYKPLSDRLEAALKALKPKQTAWLVKQDELRQAELRRAEEEALRKMQEAEEAAKKTATIDDMVAAEAAEKQAEEAMKEAARVAASKTNVKGQYGGRAMSLRTRKVAVIVDQDALYQHFRNNPDVIAVLQKLANAVVRNGNGLPGVEIKEERSAA